MIANTENNHMTKKKKRDFDHFSKTPFSSTIFVQIHGCISSQQAGNLILDVISLYIKLFI